MILYNGTPSERAKLSIINNGFKMSTDGKYGAGIYMTSYFELASEYTYNEINKDYSNDLIIPVRIYNRDIKIMQYKTLANRLGEKCKINPDYYIVSELPKAEEYARNNGIRALLIQYNYYDEIVVYDPSVIRKIG